MTNITHKKIAEIAHVLPSTVSKALSDSKEISEELKESIVKIAMDEGYFAQKSKRKIEYSSEKSVAVAIVCPEIISIAYAGEISAIKNELELKGAVVSVYIYDFNSEKLKNIIESINVGKRADGIILFGAFPSEVKSSIPIVGIDRFRADYDTVYCDINGYFDDIINYLKKLGHKKIGFIGEKHTTAKLEAYKKSLSKYNLTADPENIYIINERFESIGYTAAEKLLKRNELPTAIICAYDEIALALIKRLTEKGIEIPKKISVVGINDIPMSEYSLIPLTSVHIFEKEEAETAVKLLYDKIFNRANAIQHISVGHSLIIRKSTDFAKEEV